MHIVKYNLKNCICNENHALEENLLCTEMFWIILALSNMTVGSYIKHISSQLQPFAYKIKVMPYFLTSVTQSNKLQHKTEHKPKLDISNMSLRTLCNIPCYLH